MRILLTGAGGFVGANLAAVLARIPGADLFAADLGPPDPAPLAFLAPHAGRITWLALDVCDRAALAAAVADLGITAIVHAAAVTIPGPEEALRAAEIIDVNLGGTINVLLAAAAAPSVARVLVLSSSGVYALPSPEAAGRGAVEVEDGPLDLANLYSITKYSAELLAARCGLLAGKPVAAVRLSAIYGPLERPRPTRPGTSVMHRLMAALRAGDPVTVRGAAVSRDWTYAADAGGAVAALLLAPRWRWPVYNVSCGRATPFAEVVAAFAAHGLTARWADGAPWADGESADGAEITMDAAHARTPLSITRLVADTGFVPAHTVPQGLAAWLAAEPLRPRP